eukprot:PhM_4_TR18842/c0_g2_i1/m.100297
MKQTSYQHGSHPHPLLLYHDGVGSRAACGVCRGNVLPNATVAYCDQCVYTLCEKCFLIKEHKLDPPRAVLLSGVNETVIVRTRPKPTAHMLCLLYPHVIYCVVATVEGESGEGTYARLEYGGWILWDPAALVDANDPSQSIVMRSVCSPDLFRILHLSEIIDAVSGDDVQYVLHDLVCPLLAARLEDVDASNVHRVVQYLVRRLLDHEGALRATLITHEKFHLDESLRNRYGFKTTPQILRQSVATSMWLRQLCLLNDILEAHPGALDLTVCGKTLARSLLAILRSTAVCLHDSAMNQPPNAGSPDVFELASAGHQTSTLREHSTLLVASSVVQSSAWLLLRLMRYNPLAVLFPVDEFADAIDPWMAYMQRSGYPETPITHTVMEAYASLASSGPDDLRRLQVRLMKHDAVELIVKHMPVYPKASCMLLEVLLRGDFAPKLSHLLPVVATHAAQALDDTLSSSGHVTSNANDLLRVLTILCHNGNIHDNVSAARGRCTMSAMRGTHVVQPAVVVEGTTLCLHCLNHCAAPSVREGLTPRLLLARCQCRKCVFEGDDIRGDVARGYRQFSRPTELQTRVLEHVHVDLLIPHLHCGTVARFVHSLALLNREVTEHLLFVGSGSDLANYLNQCTMEELRTSCAHTLDLFLYLLLWDGRDGEWEMWSPDVIGTATPLMRIIEARTASPIPCSNTDTHYPHHLEGMRTPQHLPRRGEEGDGASPTPPTVGHSDRALSESAPRQQHIISPPRWALEDTTNYGASTSTQPSW